MILAQIREFRSYAAIHPRFPALADFLEREDLAALPEGRTDIDGDDLYALVSRGVRTRPLAEAPLEAHRTYIDVQVVLAGIDTMGWAPCSDCSVVSVPFDATRDIGFFANPPVSMIAVTSGCLAVFFPEDAHAPLVGDGHSVHKAVFKVRA